MLPAPVPALAAMLLCLLCLSSLAAGRGRAADSASGRPETTGGRSAVKTAPTNDTKSASADSQNDSEAYRLRITNSQYGPVELGIGGKWFLVARVVKPATDVSSGATSSLPAVIRTSANGMAFAVGAGRQVKLLPDSLQNRKDKSAIVVNVPATTSLFKDFLPPSGSPVQELNGTAVQPLPSVYTPGEDDVLEFTVRQSAIPADKLAGYVKDAAEIYQQRAASQLRAKGKTPISGNLTVTGKLAPDEDPAAVTFLVDGSIAGILNRPPYSMRLDTRQWTNGEHLIEIRAVDRAGGKLTRTRALVVVENAAANASP